MNTTQIGIHEQETYVRFIIEFWKETAARSYPAAMHYMHIHHVITLDAAVPKEPKSPFDKVSGQLLSM